MKRKKPSKQQNKYTLMVLKLLKELSKTPDARLSIREMSRVLQINHMAVSRAIKKLEPIVDIKRGSEFESFKLPLLLIRLKNEVKDLSDEELIKKLNIMNNMRNDVYRR